MSEKNQSGDVVELDLPDYPEEQNAIHDVEPESSFAENKEEIYIRNRKLAAEESYKQMKAANENNSSALKNFSAESANTVKKKSRGKNRKLRLLEKICGTAVIAFAAITATEVIFNMTAGIGSSPNISALEEADRNASNVFSGSEAGLVELVLSGTTIEGYTFENDGTVFTYGNQKTNMSFFVGDDFSGYAYGEFECSSYSAEVVYALWSAKPIPDKYKRVLTDSEQEALAKKGIIIGCYPAVD
ncbi:MAG: hypothetical protein K2J11_01520 [Oscillospiraceae bacterium]|nr:hypothetical protein [Oscillospiraceae bacterium]